MNCPEEAERLPEELTQALRALPAASSGPGFHAAVLARAAAAANRRSLRRRRLHLIAAAACAVALGLGTWSLQAARERAVHRAALVEEHRRLQGELNELRELAGRRSLIRLGGDASTDLYFDLATVPADAAAQRPADATRSQG